jgi:SAM-dependent methyltransferase
MAEGSAGDSWAAAVAALPQAARAERERPFWQALAGGFGWRRVVDAGCGAGFHLGLLRGLGVDAVGFDAALEALGGRPLAEVACADILRPPFAARTFDAALCLGNTISLLASRSLQRDALASLARLTRPGGVIIVQGEEAGDLTAAAPVVRVRRVGAARVHIRVFERRGRKVRMLAGAAPEDEDAWLREAWLLPTSPSAVGRLATSLGLTPVNLLESPPTGGSGWWAAFSVPSSSPSGSARPLRAR